MPDQAIQEFVNHWDSNAQGPTQVDLSTHVPTSNEVDNICYLSMKYGIGWMMRQADLMVVTKMLGDGDVNQLQDILSEYMWDHLMGEPENPTVEDIKLIVGAVTRNFYTLDPEVREAVEAT
jgi:hypothetical protein